MHDLDIIGTCSHCSAPITRVATVCRGCGAVKGYGESEGRPLGYFTAWMHLLFWVGVEVVLFNVAMWFIDYSYQPKIGYDARSDAYMYAALLLTPWLYPIVNLIRIVTSPPRWYRTTGVRHR